MKQYIIAPRYLFNNSQINTTEKIMLIARFDLNEHGRSITRDEFCEETGISIPTYHRSLISLEEKGFITKIKTPYREIKWKLNLTAIKKAAKS